MMQSQETSFCFQLTNKINEFIGSFNQHKIETKCFTRDGLVEQQLQVLQKLLDELRVWPPSEIVLIPELTLVCNHMLIHIAENVQSRAKSELMSASLDNNIDQTLIRVLQFTFKIEFTEEQVWSSGNNLERAVKLIVKAMEDPLMNFRLLIILGRLVLLLSYCCIHKQQLKQSEQARGLFLLLNQVLEAARPTQFLLQEMVPCQQGLILCQVPTTDKVKEGDDSILYVGDVVNLLKRSFDISPGVYIMRHPKWQWLDVYLCCRTLLKDKEYLTAMRKLEKELLQPLDPEQKSLLLCQFADCYFLQGCCQLALQTYKDALHVYRKQYHVLACLAQVYSSVGQHEFELESLNLLVKILTDDYCNTEARSFTTDMDVIISSVFLAIPNITLIRAHHMLAKCCNKLHRYKEAADNYKQILILLDNLEQFDRSGIDADNPLLDVEVKELLVEIVESQVLAGQSADCLKLCQEFYPILLADESSPGLDLLATGEPGLGSEHDQSQNSLFSQSPNFELNEDKLNASNSFPASVGMTVQVPIERREREDCPIFSSLKLSNLCSWSRKRQRSAADGQRSGVISTRGPSQDVWWSRSLLIRLLMSQADALLASQGYTDEVLEILSRALTLLMDSKISIFASDSSEQMPSKRSRLDEPGTSSFTQLGDSLTSELKHADDSLNFKLKHADDSLASKQKHAKIPVADSDKFHVSQTWRKLLISVALRMARASLQKHQTSSVVNSCHLILQLEPSNLTAHYMTTVALQESIPQSDYVYTSWLHQRGITYSGNNGPFLVNEIEQEMRKMQTGYSDERKGWWEITDLQMLKLDIVCLKNLIKTARCSADQDS